MSSLVLAVIPQTSQYQRWVLLIQPLFCSDRVKPWPKRPSINNEFCCLSRFSRKTPTYLLTSCYFADVTVSTMSSLLSAVILQTSQYQRRVLLFQSLLCRRHSINDEFSWFSRYSADVTVSTMSSLDSAVIPQTSQYQRWVLLFQSLLCRRDSINDGLFCSAVALWWQREAVAQNVTVSAMGSLVSAVALCWRRWILTVIGALSLTAKAPTFTHLSLLYKGRLGARQVHRTLICIHSESALPAP